MALTAQQFKDLKTQFCAVSDATLTAYLGQAEILIGESWPDNIYNLVLAAMTCHLLTIDGRGTDSESKSFSQGTTEFQTIKSGDLTLTRFKSMADAAGQSYGGWLSQTGCGRTYLTFARLYRSGPRVAMGGTGSAVSPYAKDWPLYPWGP